ncbi:uncharacterized protein J4E88_001135 [Alternaria novae-zelandiae]|uniref:uncharacterized protein n=1 Tax=Alternaria novae-zelandiae TaxID=430562 RepID=UPI0020C49BD2|nr:uncharacterized protein J4E88_001135 [Alternaria novae-zelandiae]KAI4692767.1 hypothetical protein J4E88_001135 [Alternaria novae-zelandiae]
MIMAQERSLRVLNLFASALTTPFLIAITVLSLESHSYRYWYDHRDVTTFCFGYIPLAMTAVASTASIVHQRRHNRTPGPKFALLDGLTGIAYLAILIPIWAVEVDDLGSAGYGFLAGYATAPMIVNMFVHFYFFACKARAMWFALRTPTIKETNKGGARYSLLRGEDYLDADADAERYIDESTRPSEEQLRPEGDDKEDKGKSSIDV